MPLYPLTNFETQKYYQNKPRFKGVYSKNNLSRINDKSNRDEYESIGTHGRALYVKTGNVTYFDTSGVKHILKGIRKFMGNKNIITNIYRRKEYSSVMSWYLCIGFIDFRLTGKSLLEYTILFSPNECKKNDKIILKYFQ